LGCARVEALESAVIAVCEAIRVLFHYPFSKPDNQITESPCLRIDDLAVACHSTLSTGLAARSTR
jgi:hypothetical protein